MTGWMLCEENINFDNFRQIVLEKGLKKFRRWNYRVVKRFGFYFWQELDPLDTLDQVSLVSKEEAEGLKEEKDLVKYCEKLFNKRFDETRPAWEWKILQNYQGSKSVLFLNVHHTMCDGMSMMTYMTFLNPDSQEVAVPEGRSIPLMFKIAYYTLFPVWIIMSYIKLKSVKPDQNIKESPIRPEGNKIKGNKQFIVSKEYKFSDLRVYKQYDCSYNDFMLGVISKSINDELVMQKCTNLKHLCLAIPVNLKFPPTCLDEVQIENNLAAAKVEMPLISELSKEQIRSIKRKVQPQLDFKCLKSVRGIQTAFTYLPYIVAKDSYWDFGKDLDIVISNIPGSKTHNFLDGKRVREIVAWAPPLVEATLNIFIHTYNGQTRIQIVSDSGLRLDAQKILDRIEEILDNKIN